MGKTNVRNLQIPENLSALFLSHGGGPLPLPGDEGHTEMVEEALTMCW